LKEEVPKILERNNQDANEDFRVFPVIGRACGWQLVPWLESMQVRPTGGVPIFSHRRPRMESELAQITLEVAEAARKINIVRRFSNRDKNIAWADLKGVIGVSNTRKDNFIQVMESNRFTVVILDEENGNNTERRRLNNHIKRVTKDTQKQTENILRDLKAQRSLSEKAMLSSVKNDSMALKGSETEQNLKVAFSREAEGNRRYLYFASKAYVEGYYDIAATFRTTAEGETGHAYGHLEYLEECGDPATGLPYGGTIENLKTAIASEAFKYGEMYPGMAKIAREEGFLEIADWFETLARAKRSHLDQFLTVLDRVDV
jgi:rubrerythrin